MSDTPIKFLDNETVDVKPVKLLSVKELGILLENKDLSPEEKDGLINDFTLPKIITLVKEALRQIEVDHVSFEIAYITLCNTVQNLNAYVIFEQINEKDMNKIISIIEVKAKELLIQKEKDLAKGLESAQEI